ncbi:unnamed protein product [Cochlearia groenlandica]
MESPNHSSHDVFNSFQSLRLQSSDKKVITPAMNSLQGGCLETGRNYNTKASDRFFSSNGDNQYLKPFPSTNTPLNHHRKSKSLVSTLFEEVNKSPDNNTSQATLSHKFIRRRQKSEADFTSRTPELLLKEENGSSNGGFSSIAGKGLALRSKASCRTNLSAESETGPVPISLMDAPPVPDRFCNVRKSLSTPSLQEPDGNGSLSLWPSSKWSLKPDLLTPAAITSSIFDGLPKPLTGRRNKTALD